MRGVTISPLEPQITEAVITVCRDYIGSDLQLTRRENIVPEDWGRNLVWRYQVENSSTGFPSTVIAKISKIGNGHIFNEWASLIFLNQFETLRGLVPAFYGGNDQLELLVIEDLGAVRGQYDLGSILEGINPALAKQALLTYARKMALLHTITSGHEDSFIDIRSWFPTYDQPILKDQFAGNFGWFLQVLPKFGLTASPALELETQMIISRFKDPDAVRAFTRGDVCPSNIAFRDHRMRFYDFEMGAFRHVLLSAAYFRISHLSCLNGSLIPLELQAEAEEQYLQDIAPLVPDQAILQTDYAAAVTAMLIWMLRISLEQKDRPRHLATLHQRIFAALTLYTQNSFFTDPYPHTTQALTQLHQVLDDRWTAGEKTILPFPAFQSR